VRAGRERLFPDYSGGKSPGIVRKEERRCKKRGRRFRHGKKGGKEASAIKVRKREKFWPAIYPGKRERGTLCGKRKVQTLKEGVSPSLSHWKKGGRGFGLEEKKRLKLRRRKKESTGRAPEKGHLMLGNWEGTVLWLEKGRARFLAIFGKVRVKKKRGVGEGGGLKRLEIVTTKEKKNLANRKGPVLRREERSSKEGDDLQPEDHKRTHPRRKRLTWPSRKANGREEGEYLPKPIGWGGEKIIFSKPGAPHTGIGGAGERRNLMALEKKLNSSHRSKLRKRVSIRGSLVKKRRIFHWRGGSYSHLGLTKRENSYNKGEVRTLWRAMEGKPFDTTREGGGGVSLTLTRSGVIHGGPSKRIKSSNLFIEVGRRGKEEGGGQPGSPKRKFPFSEQRQTRKKRGRLDVEITWGGGVPSKPPT